MASHRGILAVLEALRARLATRMGERLDGAPQVEIVGLKSLGATASGEADRLGLYLHRIAIDRFSRNLPPREGRPAPRGELPLNLHLLLVPLCTEPQREIDYLAAAIQVIGGGLQLAAADIGDADPAWGSEDSVQVAPEEMSTEDLMRVWDNLPGNYRLSAPYLIRTVRLEPDIDTSAVTTEEE